MKTFMLWFKRGIYFTEKYTTLQKRTCYCSALLFEYLTKVAVTVQILEKQLSLEKQHFFKLFMFC